jgi:imidazole glycerol-phosphate synthase subunit HisH
MIAIVKYNAGNIQSVLHSLNRIGVEAVWTDDPSVLKAADHVIFPGVGEASSAMHYLQQRGLDEVLRSLTQPVLGICLGLQLFCQHSEENNTACLGIFDVNVRKFIPTTAAPKVPHMGWNTVRALRGPLFEGIMDGDFTYFVHSFYAEISEQNTIGVCDYGLPFAAALQRDNFYAVQFHPEKSSTAGQKILSNFLKIKC